MALPPKSHAPTAEILFLQSVDVHKERGTDHHAHCLAKMPDNLVAALIITEYLGQRTGYLERALDTELSLEAYRRAGNGAQWA